MGDILHERTETVKSHIKGLVSEPVPDDKKGSERRQAILDDFSDEKIDRAVQVALERNNTGIFLLSEILLSPFWEERVRNGQNLDEVFIGNFCKGLGVNFKEEPVNNTDAIMEIAAKRTGITDMLEIELKLGEQVEDALAKMGESLESGACCIRDRHENLLMLVLPTKQSGIFACFSGNAVTQVEGTKRSMDLKIGFVICTAA